MGLLLLDREPLDPQLPATEPIDTSAIEVDMGEQAGLQPLPLGRMFRQAGRPMSPRARGQSDTQRGRVFWYGKNKSLKVDPALHDLTIKRNQRNKETIDNWNPIEAENKQRLNNTNPNPRSRPATAPPDKAKETIWELIKTARFNGKRAFDRDPNYKNDPNWSRSGRAFREFQDADYAMRREADYSEFLDKGQKSVFKSALFDYFDYKAKAVKRNEMTMEDLPYMGMDKEMRKLSNDVLYEWNARRARQLRQGTLDMLEIRRDTIRGI